MDGMIPPIPKNRRWLLIALVVLAVAAAFSPSYSRVIVRGRDGQTIDVERAGFGPQTIRVRTGDAAVESSTR